MNGFCFVLNGKNIEVEKLEYSQRIANDAFFCEYKMLNKFQEDRLFFDSKNKLILLDGVIFNKNELIGTSNKKRDWKNIYEELIEKYSVQFINYLRGSFCGIVYDHKKNEGIAFTNHSGEKALFYYAKDNLLIITSHMEIMYEMLKKNEQLIEMDSQACYEMLITGSCLHGNTMLKHVRRVTGGKYIKFDEMGAEEKRYHMFHNIPEHEFGMDECIDKADKLFRQAVDRIFQKSEEYHYKTEADLSGGLDSRLVTWVAHDLGYKNIVNVCYCQAGRLDHISSQKIAKYLGNEYFFYSMDRGGVFLKDVEEMTKVTGGQIVYCLCTGARRAFNELNLDNIGIVATGLLGEILNAYWTEGDVHTQPQYTNVRYSDIIDLKIPKEYAEEYDNYEQMNLYEFSNLFFLSSAFSRQDRCEVYSPFVDKDFLEFAYRIPLKYRKNYYFTQNWILKKYPEAAKFVWQTKMKPIDKAYYHKIYGPKIVWNIEDYILRVYNKICRILKINSQIALKGDMNPLQLWYDSNPELRDFFIRYYMENKFVVKDEALKAKMEKMFQIGNCRDKALVINLLAILKEYNL